MAALGTYTETKRSNSSVKSDGISLPSIRIKRFLRHTERNTSCHIKRHQTSTRLEVLVAAAVAIAVLKY